MDTSTYDRNQTENIIKVMMHFSEIGQLCYWVFVRGGVGADFFVI